MSDKAQRVQALLRTHEREPWTTGQIAHALDLSLPDVSKALGELVRAGLAHRPTGKTGTYAAGPGTAA
jgi:predicted transcriptional regulator